MTRVEELAGQLGSARGAIQLGLHKAMRAAGPGDQAAATLIAGASRMTLLSNAVALLCRYGRGAESLSLVKSMVVTALAMCWAVSTEDLGEELKQEIKELQLWRADEATAPTPDRLDLVGLTDSEAEAAEAVLRRMEVPATGAVPQESPTPGEALTAANRAMTAALWALDKRWPAAFPVLPPPPEALLICSQEGARARAIPTTKISDAETVLGDSTKTRRAKGKGKGKN